MCHLIGEHKPMTWFAEAGPIRRSIEPFLRKRMDERRTFCNIEWLPSIMDKATRARPFQAMASMGKVKIPKDKPWLAHVMAQWLQFPAGRYDDAVDAASLIGRGLEFTRSARRYEPLQYQDLRIP
jgi:predicted phage terminase large subunit-like protein